MLEVTCAALVAIGIYLILEGTLVTKSFGIIVLSAAINLILLTCGRLTGDMPAFIQGLNSEVLANPLPQALILTAIVIGFGLFSFLIVLIRVLLVNELMQKAKK